MKLIFTFYLCLFSFITFCLPSIQEQDVHALKIKYQIFVENIDSLEVYKYAFPYEEVHYVASDKILSVQKFNDDQEGNLKIYDLKEQNYFSCFLNNIGEKIAAKLPFQNIVNILEKKEAIKKYQIAGMPCERYAASHQGVLLEIFTTDIFGIDFCPLSKTSGYAMQYSYFDPQFGKITYLATEVLPTKVDYNLFSIEEFKIQRGMFETEQSKWNSEIVKHESSSFYSLFNKKIKYKLKSVDGRTINPDTQKGTVSILMFRGYLNLGAVEKDVYLNFKQKYSDKNIDFFPIVFSESLHFESYKDLKRLNLNPVLSKNKLTTQFKVEYYPTVIIIDGENKVSYYRIGFDSDLIRDLDIEINKALK